MGERTLSRRRADFDGRVWESPVTGVGRKCLYRKGLCMRVVESRDGIFVPAGPAQGYRATVRAGRALAYFVEPA